MSRGAPRFQVFVTMSSRAPYRGGRTQWRRGFSDRPYNDGGRGHFVIRDSHFRSVHDSNLRYRQGSFSNHQFTHTPPRSPQNRPVRPRPADYRSWEQAKVAPPPNSERFVVLSYNLLADYLAFNHRSKLYFHIPRHILDWEWRKRSILFELGLWSADVMCLQEVDRFQDLEEELKVRGYSGIWKMRTGNAIDGCAIFWRSSRFKLLYEEGIEFNKLGLRDNVAQICVFELLGKSFNENTAPPPTSSSHSNKVVVCNIHVLYNPKRGEIKLGQVRTLLDRAHDVSKIWNDAPVVLCGDFNCTPKSPLYNFIAEQKLDLSAVDRDKISGQASAEICAPRPDSLNPRAQPFKLSIQAPSVVAREEVGIKPSDSLSDVEKDNKDGNTENIPLLGNSSVSQSTDTLLSVSDKAFSKMQGPIKDSAVSDVVTKETQHNVLDGSKESSSCLQSIQFPTDRCQKNDEIQNISPPGKSLPADESDETDEGCKERENTSHSNNRSPSEHSDSNISTEYDSLDCNDSMLSVIGNDNSSRAEISADATEVSAYEPADSTAPTSFDFVVAHKLENLSTRDLDEARAEGLSIDEDDNTFLSALHNNEDAFPSDSGQYVKSNTDPSTVELGGEMFHEMSPALDDEPVNVENIYDPSLWTPMERATATGNANCTCLEHPLQLKSTYAEVEDFGGTRDSNGEPLVTSYNRCFMGTVDYIWRSKGLQTVRVLGPIPKHAMQWTPGFPTKKWGSDHIALASEVAFLRD